MNRPREDEVHVLGVDGCRTGWVVVTLPLSASTVATCAVMDTAALGRAARAAEAVGIDVPIGLREGRDADGAPSRRLCDHLARHALGRAGASVFPAPTREWLAFARDRGTSTADYRAVNACARAHQGQGISKQAFFISPKVRDVDDLLRRYPELRAVLHEVHPELSFRAMLDRRPLASKKTPAGCDQRFARLARHLGDATLRRLFSTPLPGAAEDDLLDACAAAWTARRIARRQARARPEQPDRDPHGIRMQIWT